MYRFDESASVQNGLPYEGTCPNSFIVCGRYILVQLIVNIVLGMYSYVNIYKLSVV